MDVWTSQPIYKEQCIGGPPFGGNVSVSDLQVQIQVHLCFRLVSVYSSPSDLKGRYGCKRVGTVTLEAVPAV